MTEDKITKLYYSIGEVAKLVGVETHVLRYWENEFPSSTPERIMLVDEHTRERTWRQPIGFTNFFASTSTHWLALDRSWRAKQMRNLFSVAQNGGTAELALILGEHQAAVSVVAGSGT